MPRAVLVLDASLTLSWFFKDERTPGADAVLTEITENGAVVPALWRLEVANALQMAVRRKRIDAAFRDSALTQLSRLSISADADTDAYAWTLILQLADRFQLTLYMQPIWSWPAAVGCRSPRLTGNCGMLRRLLGFPCLALIQPIKRHGSMAVKAVALNRCAIVRCEGAPG